MNDQETQERIRRFLEDRRLDALEADLNRKIVLLEARRVRSGVRKPRKRSL